MRAVVVLALAVVVCASPRRRADDFFSSSPGRSRRATRRSTTRTSATTATSTARKDLDNNKCLDCHDHNDLRGRIARGQGLSRVGDRQGQELPDLPPRAQGPRLRHHGLEVGPGRREGLQPRSHRLAAQRQARADRLRRVPQDRKQAGPQDVHGHRQAVRLVGLSQQRSAAQVRAQGHARLRALPRRERVEAGEAPRARSSTTTTARTPRCRCSAATRTSRARSATPRACSTCRSPSPTPAATRLPPRARTTATCSASATASGATRRRSRRSSSRTSITREKTRFDLGPAHKKIKCYDCHTKALGEGKPNGACEQLPRQGQPPRRSLQASSATRRSARRATRRAARSSRRTSFNHAREHEVHADRQARRRRVPRVSPRQEPVGLRASSRTSSTPNGKVECMSCHEHKNVHDKKYNETTSAPKTGAKGCHSDAGKLEFDYKNLTERYHGPQSKFPLVKGHKGVPCSDCHTGRKKKGKTTFDKIPTDCNASGKCHEDSLHKGSLGEECVACHSSRHVGRAQVRSRRAVPRRRQGRGQELPAQGRAPEERVRGLPPASASSPRRRRRAAAEGCHADDDAHKGRLGNKCEKCHVETGDNIFNHNTMSRVPARRQAPRRPLRRLPPVDHVQAAPDRLLWLSPRAARAQGPVRHRVRAVPHDARRSTDVKPLHDVGDFSLRGMHDNLACERCHKDNRPLAGSGNLCINCHRQDDIHNNSLSPRCGECHTQWSFTPARFDHARVGCNLTGLHRTFACFDCHATGNFVGLSRAVRELPPRRRARAGTRRRRHTEQIDCARPATTRTRGSPQQAPARSARESVCR